MNRGLHRSRILSFRDINLKNIFIVGVGRSGTSLLQSMIGSHSKITTLPENSILRRYLGSRNSRKRMNQGDVSFFNSLIDDEKIKRLNKDISSEELAAVSKNSGPEKVYEYFLESNVTTEFVCDKDPKLIEYLSLIHNLRPNSYIVHIIRDPRDVLLSKKKAEWSKKGSVFKHVFANKVQLELAERLGAELFAGRYITLKYEDLIQNPERTLDDICDKLSIVFEPKMLNFSDVSKTLVSKEEVSWKKETLGPILATNKKKWENELSHFDILLVESCLRDAFSKFGYRKSILERNILEKGFFTIIRLVNVMLTGLYIKYVLWKQN
nr:sulfotransferase [Vibrio echinoideorum]